MWFLNVFYGPSCSMIQTCGEYQGQKLLSMWYFFFNQYSDWIVYHKRLPTGVSGKTHLKPIKWNGSMDISS